MSGLDGTMDIMLQRLLIGFAATLVFGIIAFSTEMVDDSGFFTGVLLFTSVYVFLDWQAYVIIVPFFFMTGNAINAENRYKRDRGEFELYKAKRPAARVLGRSLAGTIFAGAFFMTEEGVFKVAFVAAYSEAIWDTVSTKLGQLLNKKAVNIMTFQTVPHGTAGGISHHGTLCGAAAALVLGLAGALTGLIKFHELLIVMAGALAGMLFDSFLNAFSHQKKHIPNELINFLGSASAGLICILLILIMQPR
ncbi:MAG: DUF92 domain-containing protein [Candidatus Omnitrophica bacterium]|nr:DUF92 domain-containing protein [Candidatus Omnitrophota bacterium]